MAPVDDMTTELESIRLIAISMLLAAMADADMSTPESAWETLREAFIDIAFLMGEQAAMSAIRYLELDRTLAGVRLPSPRPSDRISIDELERSFGWATRPLTTGDLELVERQLTASLQRHVDEPNRTTIYDATVQAKTRFARVPTGDDPCSFCLMLASRGAVYHTELTATATTGRSTGTSGRPDTMRYHDHCFCQAREIRVDNEDDLPDIIQRAQQKWDTYSESVRGAVTLDGFTDYLKDHPFK